MSKRRLKAGIIGLGKIGMEYDLPDSGSRVMTHTKALMLHDGFDLVWGVDSVKSKRDVFENFSKIRAYSTIGDAFSAKSVDVVVVATPVCGRMSVIEEVVAHQPGFLIIEKPLAKTVLEADELVRLCDAANVSAFVNYVRRCDPGVLRLRDIIRAGEIGSYQAGGMYYSGGFFNIASHYIDLARFLLESEIVCDWARMASDECVDDSGIDFMCSIGKKSFSGHAVEMSNCCMGEMELVFERGLISYADCGRRIVIRRSEDDPDCLGGMRLSHDIEVIENNLSRYQWNVFQHVYYNIVNSEALLCDLVAARSVLSLCCQIKEKACNG